MENFSENLWAVILGGSGGLGLAAAKKLSASGMNLCLVHRDRRGVMKAIEPEFEKLRESGVTVLTINLDALTDEGRNKALEALEEKIKGGKVRLLLHAIAFGNLKLLAPLKEEKAGQEYDNERMLGEEDFRHTIHAMGTSLAQWVRDIFEKGLFSNDARVLALTSEGSTRAWRGYAAVSAAKAALESLTRALAVEYGPHGIRANVLQAGVTDTRALAAIPGHLGIMEEAREKNPLGRLTQPGDVADVIRLLCSDEAAWINGAHIRADGGEAIA